MEEAAAAAAAATATTATAAAVRTKVAERDALVGGAPRAARTCRTPPRGAESADPTPAGQTPSSDAASDDRRAKRKDGEAEDVPARRSGALPSTPREVRCPVKCEPQVLSHTLNERLCTKPAMSNSGRAKVNVPKLVLDYITPSMNQYGLCFVDGFLGPKTGDRILQEVVALHRSGSFEDGELASQRIGTDQPHTAPAGPCKKTIRGDKIMWVQGNEPGCASIGQLLQRMDKLIMHADGNLGHYTIRGRHKACRQDCGIAQL
eukprot:gi/632952041/ref/XP_007891627.1/ PREDICTED: egl nine homolog 1-like [Callorhinchus milii]